MNIWHKRFLYLQIIVLLIITALAVFEGSKFLLPGMILFVLLEFGTLEAQRKENPAAVLYQKGCLFALADLASVIIFLIYFITHLYLTFTTDHNYYVEFYPVLFLYIAARKFYILKNYSYEL